MTTRGKFVITVLILAVVSGGVWRWWDKIAPAGKSQQVSVNPQEFKKSQDAGKPSPEKAVADVASKLLAGEKAVSLVDGSAIPPVTGVSDYDKPMKDGKLVLQFPINIWPGWAPIIVANNGLEPNEGSVFYKKYGFYVKLAIVDDPVKARDLFASGHSHVLWGTLDMMALFAPELVKDSRTVPVICQQIDWSGGGDGIVARGDIRNINDFRMHNGKRRKVVLAQNSPSHYLVMSLLIDAGIVLLGLSVVTLRQYVHVAPLWVVLTLSGAALVILALVIERALRRAPEGHIAGFTADPLFSDGQRQQALQIVPVVAAFTPAANSPTAEEQGFAAGGGRFGGGATSLRDE